MTTSLVLLILSGPTVYASDYPSIYFAGVAAGSGGTVIIDGVYEYDDTVPLIPGVTYKGGTIRRACATVAEVLVGGTCPVLSESMSPGVYLRVKGPAYADFLGYATLDSNGCAPISLDVGDQLFREFVQARVQPAYGDGIVIDGVTFDGQVDCNDHTHHWQYNNALWIRGYNQVLNSTFINMPSENITSCGGVFVGNRAHNLAGSFVHKSCTGETEGDVFVGNVVSFVNWAGDIMMDHSEGAVTLSENAGRIVMVGNTFSHGGEGVFGWASGEDADTVSVNDLFTDFAFDIHLYSDAVPESHRWVGTTFYEVGQE